MTQDLGELLAAVRDDDLEASRLLATEAGVALARTHLQTATSRIPDHAWAAVDYRLIDLWAASVSYAYGMFLQPPVALDGSERLTGVAAWSDSSGGQLLMVADHRMAWSADQVHDLGRVVAPLLPSVTVHLHIAGVMWGMPAFEEMERADAEIDQAWFELTATTPTRTVELGGCIVPGRRLRHDDGTWC